MLTHRKCTDLNLFWCTNSGVIIVHDACSRSYLCTVNGFDVLICDAPYHRSQSENGAVDDEQRDWETPWLRLYWTCEQEGIQGILLPLLKKRKKSIYFLLFNFTSDSVGVMVSAFTLILVGRWFTPRLCHTKVFKNGTCCFLAWRSAFKMLSAWTIP